MATYFILPAMLMRGVFLLLAGCFGIAVAWAGSASEDRSHEPIQPLRAIVVDADKAALGDRLFHEPRLSGDNSISCAHCHILEEGGADPFAASFGVDGAVGEMNSPTVFNAALNIAQFWDGRAKTLEDQIDGPLHNKVEMDSNWPDVVKKISADQSYVSSFKQLYDGEISEQTIKHAIAEFERTLITLDSRFDQYLRGDDNAINDKEKKGYQLFKGFGCVACHQGENVGGNLFQSLGIMEDYFATYDHIDQHDYGRFNVTGNPLDKHVFKVPSLRLVTLTAPYFHDGKFDKLEDAIRTMAKFQVGIIISDAEIAYIVAFLQTLPGKHAKLDIESSTEPNSEENKAIPTGTTE